MVVSTTDIFAFQTKLVTPRHHRPVHLIAHFAAYLLTTSTCNIAQKDGFPWWMGTWRKSTQLGTTGDSVLMKSWGLENVPMPVSTYRQFGWNQGVWKLSAQFYDDTQLRFITMRFKTEKLYYARQWAFTPDRIETRKSSSSIPTSATFTLSPQGRWRVVCSTFARRRR